MSDEIMPRDDEVDSKVQRDSDDEIVKILTERATEFSDRTKHILVALSAAGVPLDFLTADALQDLSLKIENLLNEACDDDD